MKNMRDKFFGYMWSGKIARYRKKELEEEKIKFENYKMRHGERKSWKRLFRKIYCYDIFYASIPSYYHHHSGAEHTHNVHFLLPILVFFPLSSRLIPCVHEKKLISFQHCLGACNSNLTMSMETISIFLCLSCIVAFDEGRHTITTFD